MAPYAGLYNRCITPLIAGRSDEPLEPPDPPINLTRNKYDFVFQELEDLIDDNRDCQAIDHQLRQDRTQNYKLSQQANVIIRRNQTKSELVVFFYATCYAPVKSTFIKAVTNNHSVSWPGLDADLTTKHLESSEHTIKEHIARERMYNLRK